MNSRAPLLALIALLAVVSNAACGGRRAAPPVTRSTADTEDFVTALGAVDLAIQEAPGSSRLARLNASFPRQQGRAEFWTVDLIDSESPESIKRVEIEGGRAVSITSLSFAAAGLAPGFQGVQREELLIDSSEAVDQVRDLEWVDRNDTVTLSGDALGIGPPDGPDRARLKPFWQLQIKSAAAAIKGVAWLLTIDGSVVFECRASNANGC